MKTKTKVDIVAFLTGVSTVLVARFLLNTETKEVLMGFSLQGYCYIIGLLSMSYAILPRLGDALLSRFGLKVKSSDDRGESNPPDPPPKKHRKDRSP